MLCCRTLKTDSGKKYWGIWCRSTATAYTDQKQHKRQETRIVLCRQLGGVLCSGCHYTTQHPTPVELATRYTFTLRTTSDDTGTMSHTRTAICANAVCSVSST